MMVTSANALNELTHAHNKFNKQQHNILCSHMACFIELIPFVKRGVVNPSAMTVNIHRVVIKGDVTSATKDDRFIGYDLRNDTSKEPNGLKSSKHLLPTSRYLDNPCMNINKHQR